jgi:hypothetical protein
MKTENEQLINNNTYQVFAWYAFGFENHRKNLTNWQVELVNELYRKSLYLHQLRHNSDYHNLI